MLDSIRARLTLWYSVVLALVLILLALITYGLYWRSISQRVDTNLQDLSDTYALTLHAEMEDLHGPAGVKSAAKEAMLEHRFRDVVYVVLDRDGNVLQSSLDLPTIASTKEHFDAEIFQSPEFRKLLSNAPGQPGVIGTIPGGKEGFRAISRTITEDGASYKLVVMQSLHPQMETMDDIRETFTWVIPMVLALASVGGYFLARKSLAPVVQMARQASGMGAANLTSRLAVVNERDELGQLALTFNQLLERLEQSFERQRRFVADASHELRTPVAILRGESEVALSRPDRSSEEYRETLAILQDESQRLAHIIEDLFTLTRADAGQYPLAFHELYLDELIADVVKRTRSLAIPKQIELSCASDPELSIRADEALLRRMLLNMLDNAIKYTPEGGKVSVECRKSGEEYIVKVTDTGVGIPEDVQTRIFERFFRADKARSRSEGESGGAGLGLSIARWIAEAHDGRLELTRSDTSGSVFTAYLPVKAKG